jgi:hypothetical protein
MAFSLKNIQRDTIFVEMEADSEDIVSNVTADTIVSLTGTIHNGDVTNVDIIVEIVDNPGMSPETTIRKFYQTLEPNDTLVIQPSDCLAIKSNQKITVSIADWNSGRSNIVCHFDQTIES